MTKDSGHGAEQNELSHAGISSGFGERNAISHSDISSEFAERNVLSLSAIGSGLGGRNIDLQIFDTVDSTNRLAGGLIMEKRVSGLATMPPTIQSDSNKQAELLSITQNDSDKAMVLVTADEQQSGRGRLGRSFLSPKGTGIYMSCGFRFDACDKNALNESLLLTVTPITAVIVRRAIYDVCGIGCDIKWINDLYLNGAKVCGILTELLPGNAIVIGIGINCFKYSVPDELRSKVGFLAGDRSADTDNVQWTRSELIARIAGGIYDAFCANSYKDSDKEGLDSFDKNHSIKVNANTYNSNTFLSEYKQHCFNIGKKVSVKNAATGEVLYDAEVKGIDDLFRLVVLPDGRSDTVTLLSEEISII